MNLPHINTEASSVVFLEYLRSTVQPHKLAKSTKTSDDRGCTLVKVLCYKSEGRWFYPRWCHWNFSLT